MSKYKDCRDVTREECYVGGKFCHTCMYRDNKRDKQGFRLSPEESGIPDFCIMAPREG